MPARAQPRGPVPSRDAAPAGRGARSREPGAGRISPLPLPLPRGPPACAPLRLPFAPPPSLFLASSSSSLPPTRLYLLFQSVYSQLRKSFKNSWRDSCLPFTENPCLLLPVWPRFNLSEKTVLPLARPLEGSLPAIRRGICPCRDGKLTPKLKSTKGENLPEEKTGGRGVFFLSDTSLQVLTLNLILAVSEFIRLLPSILLAGSRSLQQR